MQTGKYTFNSTKVDRLISYHKKKTRAAKIISWLVRSKESEVYITRLHCKVDRGIIITLEARPTILDFKVNTLWKVVYTNIVTCDVIIESHAAMSKMAINTLSRGRGAKITFNIV